MSGSPASGRSDASTFDGGGAGPRDATAGDAATGQSGDDAGAETGASTDGPSVISTTKRWPDSPTPFCASNVAPMATCPQPMAPFYGQDGSYLIDAVKLTVAGETASESVTGLVWDHRAMRPTLDRASAIAHCQGLSLGGFSDWRLPSLLELASVVDYGRHDPAADPTVFATETAWMADPGGWTLDFSTGAVQATAVSQMHAVRCVRGAPLVSSLKPSGETVVDVGLGLEWQGAASPTSLNWGAALDFCNHATLAGYSDWRLPSIKELLTLISIDALGMAILGGGLVAGPDAGSYSGYISSTPCAGLAPSGEAPEMRGWAIQTSGGSFGVVPAGLFGSTAVRCVRR